MDSESIVGSKIVESKSKLRGIPPRILTSHGYSVCLFPEQPKRQVVVEEDLPATEESFQKDVFRNVEARSKPSSSDEERFRLYWRNRLVYLIAFIAFCTSLNNVYLFPMNVYRYGITFFVPYTLATLIIGYPMHVLETSMGQYSQYGSLWVWSCAPLGFGVGFAMITVCIVTSLYYNIFAAYSVVYFAHCFFKVTPWTYCSDISWSENEICVPPSLLVSDNVTIPTKDYFYSVILNTPNRHPPEVWEIGYLKWWLSLALLFSWFFTYVATLRSSRSIGKVAVIIVIFSYFAILTLLVVAFQIKNSGKLILHKESENVFNIKMWCSAIIQVLLELGICYGIPIVYGSYCRFHNVVYVDSIIICVINYLNSLVFFYLFFSFIRSFSCNYDNIPLQLPDNSVGVIYMIYLEAFTTLSGNNLWCGVFFFMLFLIIIGSQIAIIEAIMAALYDNFVKLSQYRWLINLIICSFFFFFGIIFCTTNGYFGVLTLYYIPRFFTSIPLAFLFLFGITFVYGFEQYSQNMKSMLGLKLNIAVKLFLCSVAVIFFIFIVIMLFSIYTSIFSDGTWYSDKNKRVAWMLCIIIICSVILCTILFALSGLYARKKMWEPLYSWKNLEEKKKEESGQFTSVYSSAYTWEWNKYE